MKNNRRQLLRPLHLSISLFVLLLAQQCCYTTAQHEAIFLGSSGLVGGLVLDQLLAAPDSIWEKVHTIVRKPSGRQHAKLHEIVVPDLSTMLQNDELIELAAAAAGNKVTAAFHTLGVNDAFGWTLQQLLDVEVTLTEMFAKYCYDKLGVQYISVLSMVDATRGGEPFTEKELGTKITLWNIFKRSPRIKGAMEEAVVNTGIPYCAFFQPSNFETDEYRFGIGDAAFQWLFRVFNRCLPHKWRSIHVNDLAHAMSRYSEKVMHEIDAHGDEEKGGIMQHQEDVKLTYLDFWEAKHALIERTEL